ncbi:transmembrane domain-containing protein [Cryptosporidium canis]|nr:transmembrane domain-containing protein [Cryptosporidium canis]
MRGVSLVQSSPDGGLPLARIYRTNVGEYVQEVSSWPSGSFSLLCLLLLTTLCVSQGWRVGLLLIIVGASPGVAIIGLFRSQIRQGEVSIKTISDLFTFGATVSVSTALILEGLIFGRIFDTGSDLEFGYSCVVELPLYMLAVLLKYIISVGLVEESCKLMGLLTLKPHVEDLSYRESFLSHYVHSNLGFVIGGVSSSLGFALIENIAYLSNSTENILLMILIGIARTFLSVPFHISASGYSCIILSRYIFREDDLHGSRAPESTSTSTFMSDVLSSDLLKKTLAVSRAVLPAALLHGIYDSSLAILVLLEQDGDTETSPEPELKQTRGWLFSSLSRLAALSPRHFGAKKLITSLKRHGHDGYRFLNGFGGFVVAVYQFVCSRLAGPGEAHLQQEGPGGWGRAGGRGSWRGGRAR